MISLNSDRGEFGLHLLAFLALGFLLGGVSGLLLRLHLFGKHPLVAIHTTLAHVEVALSAVVKLAESLAAEMALPFSLKLG